MIEAGKQLRRTGRCPLTQRNLRTCEGSTENTTLVRRPASDPFGSEIELRNVESPAANYAEAGADRLVLAGVCES